MANYKLSGVPHIQNYNFIRQHWHKTKQTVIPGK